MKLKAGDAAGALTAYKESLEIRRDLAKDMSNTVAQRGLAISDENVADALKKLGKLEDALPYDEADIAIFERLLQLDNNSETALDDLAIALSRVGTDLRKLGRLDEAFVDYDRSLALRRRLANAHPERSDLRDNVEEAAGNLGGLAFNLLLVKKFEKALEASDRAIAAAPGHIWIDTNCAHALMFLGRVEEARTLYLAHRGEKTLDDKIWEDVILEDFAELRKAGLTNPLMDEIESTFAKKH